MLTLLNRRGAKPASHDLSGAPAVQPDPDVDTQRRAATHAIGERQERLVGALEATQQLSGQLAALEKMLGDLREPLNDEFSSYRRDHAELVVARASTTKLAEALEESRTRQADASERLERTEQDWRESDAARLRAERQLESVEIEFGRLREEAKQLEVRGEALGADLRTARLQIKQLEEDAATLRDQQVQDEERRREMDSLLAHASQEALLLEEEAARLRRRAEQTGTELARVLRSEEAAQVQLEAERSRALALQATAERAQTEAQGLARQLEERAEAFRAETAALAGRLETASARASKLETLNADLSGRHSEAVAGQRQAERRLAETHTGVDRSNERLQRLEQELAEQRAGQAATERARLAAVERAEQLARTLQAHETTVRRAEERLRDQQARLEASAAEGEQRRREHEEETTRQAAEVHRLRTELALAEASLETARRERAASRTPEFA